VRFLLEAGEAIIFPVLNQFVSRWIPTRERGIANGLIFAGVGVEAGAAPVIVTYIMVHYGWRASFWVSACLGLLVGAVWFVAARDNPEEHSHVSATELQYIEENRTAGSDASATRDGKTTWEKILQSKEVWGVSAEGVWARLKGQRILQHDSSYRDGYVQFVGRSPTH
jgi:ACS family glucarate transporter-like MFS transporter